MKQSLKTFVLVACVWPSHAYAQAPSSAPLVLSAPTSARVAALGSAWVAGRDQDVLFTNPAQLIGTRTDFSLSLARLGAGRNMGSMTSAYAAGKMSFTLGWGGVLLTQAPGTAPSALGALGAAVVYKGFRVGAAGKYLSHHELSSNGRAWLFDVGLARNVLGGAAGLAVQNLGSLDDLPNSHIRKQVAVGWSTTRPAGPLDLALFTQVTARSDWAGPAAGLEVGYSWIEGYLVTLRAGARRTEAANEKPVSLGAAFSLDRLTLEYALQLFDNSRRAHRMTIRWR